MAQQPATYLLSQIEECLSDWNKCHKKEKCIYCDMTINSECEVYYQLDFFVKGVPGIFTKNKEEINFFIQKASGLLYQLFNLEK